MFKIGPCLEPFLEMLLHILTSIEIWPTMSVMPYVLLVIMYKLYWLHTGLQNSNRAALPRLCWTLLANVWWRLEWWGVGVGGGGCESTYIECWSIVANCPCVCYLWTLLVFKLSYCREDLQYFYYFLVKYEQFTVKERWLRYRALNLIANFITYLWFNSVTHELSMSCLSRVTLVICLIVLRRISTMCWCNYTDWSNLIWCVNGVNMVLHTFYYIIVHPCFLVMDIWILPARGRRCDCHTRSGLQSNSILAQTLVEKSSKHALRSNFQLNSFSTSNNQIILDLL
jgi:hypothetical protein